LFPFCLLVLGQLNSTSVTGWWGLLEETWRLKI
jgi:hypothetical protein